MLICYNQSAGILIAAICKTIKIVAGGQTAAVYAYLVFASGHILAKYGTHQSSLCINKLKSGHATLRCETYRCIF